MTTALQIAEKAIELADQNPDFVYAPPGGSDNFLGDCVYVHEGQGSCLFGQAILATGAVDANYLDYNGLFNIKSLVQYMAREDVLDDEGTSGLLEFMRGAQIAQDRGTPWADAVAELREYLGSVKA